MLDIEQFKGMVHQIQEVLYGHVNLDSDAVKTLHREYGAAVDEINRRLKNCCELLNKGQRTDALQECDVPPNLFEVVDVADFRERFLWGEFSGEADLPTPPDLEKSLAEQIVAAVPQEARLKQLMKRHRLLALARSPLRLRLKALREIQSKDPENKLWRPDIRSYEQERLKEIKRESKVASDGSDLKQLGLLVHELEDSDWLDSVPSSLAEFVQKGHSRVRKALAMQELEVIAGDLNDAFQDLDLQHARELRQRWRGRVLIVEIGLDDPLSEQAAPALDWLLREDEKDRVQNEFVEWLQTLNGVLEEEIPHKIGGMESHRSSLSRVYDQVEQLRNDLDDDQGELLEQVSGRVHQRLSLMQDRERRVRRNRLVGIVLSIMLVAGLAGWGIDHALLVRRASQFADKIQKLVDGGELESGGELLESVRVSDSRAFNHPDVQGVVANLDAAKGHEQTRLGTRQKFVRAIRDRLKDATWETRDEAQRLFEELEKHSNPAKDSREDAELETEIGSVTATLQKQADTAFLEEFERIKQVYKADDLKVAEKTNGLIERLLEIPRVTGGLLPPARVFQTRVNTDVNSMRRSNRRGVLFDAITSTVGDVAKFRGELENFSKLPDYRGEPTSKDFTRVVEQELLLVRGVAGWTKLTREVSSLDLSNVSLEDAKRLSTQISSLLDEYPEHPAAKPVAQLKKYIDSVLARVGDDGADLVEDLEKILNSSIIADLFMCLTKDGMRYYCRKRPSDKGQNLRVEHYTKLDLSETKVRLLSLVKLANLKNSDGEIILESPQSRFRLSTLRKIDQLRLNEGEWHTLFMKMLIELRDDRQMEPLLKFQLLHVVSNIASFGHAVVAESLQADRLVLEKARIEIDRNVNWIHPMPPEGIDEVKKARRDAERTIDKLVVLKTLEKTLPERISNELKQPDLGLHFEWVGWLHKGVDGNFQCSMGPNVSRDVERDLYLLFPVDGGDTIATKKIGSYRKGTVRLELGDVSFAVEGRPVYAAKPQK